MGDQSNSEEWGKEMSRTEHESTYAAFLDYTKYGIIAVTAILLGLLIFVY